MENCVPIARNDEVFFGDHFEPETRIISQSGPINSRPVRLIMLKSDSKTNHAGNDNHRKSRYAQPMNDITREELQETISGLERGMDKRLERMEMEASKRSDDLRREMRLRDRSARRETLALNEALKAHVASNDRAVSSALSALERTEAEFGKVKQANKEQRYWMAGIGVAIVLGIMGANATIFGGGKAFFDGGKDAVKNQQEVDAIIRQAQEQTEANRRLLDEIRASQLRPKTSDR